MVTISNVKVYDLPEAVISCRNAMRLTPPEYTDEEFAKSLERAKKLCKSPSNSGHANFLTGIRVSFDIKYPNYFSPELQRYHFLDIVTSASKMHRLMMMAGNPDCYNKYVAPEIIDFMKNLVDEYNNDPSYINFMKVVSNCPLGIELFMRCSTNYMQLKNIYNQRKNHKLKEDWGEFCNFIKSLPFAKDFIIGEE